MTDNGTPPKPRDYRHHCGRLLFRGRLPPGTYIEIRCPKCGLMHPIDARLRGTGVLKLTHAPHTV